MRDESVPGAVATGFRGFQVIAVLWPIALLTPFIPWIPRPYPSGRAWRQELIVSALLLIASVLLARNSFRKRSPDLLSDRNLPQAIVPLGIFVVLSGFSILWSQDGYAALHHTLTWLAYILFFWLVYKAIGSRRVTHASMIVFAVVLTIIASTSIIGAIATPISLFRDHGLGEPLAIAVPLFASLSLGLRRRKAALACGTVAILTWLAMLQVFERAAFMSTMLALLLMTAISLGFRHYRPRSFLRALFLAGSLIGAMVVQHVVALSPSIGAKAPETVISRLKTTGSSDENTQVRLLFWRVALGMAQANPVLGVGAGNYDSAYPEFRAKFAEQNPNSGLTDLLEGFLVVRTHNEYLQVLSELGIAGLLAFLLFCAVLLWKAWSALRTSTSFLVPGCIGSLAVFAINSGASAMSFRWFGSGIIFFFLAAIIFRLANERKPEVARNQLPVSAQKTSLLTGAQASRLHSTFTSARKTAFASLAISVILICAMGAQGLNVVYHGSAQVTPDPALADRRFQLALLWNPYDPATHFNYGIWLFYQKRPREAVEHLRYGLERGFNTSVCYVFLAASQDLSGTVAEAEQTLAQGIRVYPRSIFLLTRHAKALADLGREYDSKTQLARARAIDEGAALGWWNLISFGRGRAASIALRDPAVQIAGDLKPEGGVFLILEEVRQRQIAAGCPDDSFDPSTVKLLLFK